MSELIERMAKALVTLGIVEVEPYPDQVRDLLDVIREPTEKMKAAGKGSAPIFAPIYVHEIGAMFTAMIDAELGEAA